MHAPNGGIHAWANVFLTFSIYLICVGFQYSLGIFQSAFLLDGDLTRGLSRADVSFAAALESSCFLFGTVPAGLLYGRLGPRGVCLFGAALVCVGSIVAIHASSFGAVQAGFLLIGLGLGAPMSAAISCTMPWFDTLRATASGISVAGSGVGAIVFGPLLQWQVDLGGWRQALRFFSVVACVGVPICAAALRPLPRPALPALSNESRSVDDGWVAMSETPRAASAETSPAASETSAAPEAFPGSEPDDAPLSMWALVVQNHSMRSFMTYIGLFGGAWFVLIAHFNSAAREQGTSADDAAVLVSVQGFSNTIWRLIVGFCADALKSLTKLQLLQLCCFMTALFTALLAIPACLKSFPFQVLFMIINGLFGGSVASLQAPIVADLVGVHNMPASFALIHMIQSPMVLLLPPAAGALRTLTGWPAVWASAGALVFLASCALSTIKSVRAGGGPWTLASFRCVKL